MQKDSLSPSEVEKSRRIYGENELKGKKKRSFFRCYLSNLNDPIIKVLIVALLINTFVSLPKINYLESIGIAISILVSTLVSTICEYSSENAFEKLKNTGQKKLAILKRGGEVVEIQASEIVVGDTVILEAGEKIPADCLIVSGRVQLDESALTGESCEVEKSACKESELEKIRKEILSSLEKGEISKIEPSPKNTLYSGSTVVGGYCEAIVTSVGSKTFLGKEADSLGESKRPSPLKNRLLELAKFISRLGYVAAGVIALAYLLNIFVVDSGFEKAVILSKITDFKFLFSHLVRALTLAVSITVVAVPEGLPMMITVVLSSNMKKMARDNVLVKKMVGIETSGNINLLFTDKTGTITEGKLKVKEIIGASTLPLDIGEIKKQEKLKKILTLCAYFCTNAKKQGTKTVGKDSVERALIDYCSFYKPRAEIKEKIPFDSAKKYSAVSLKSEGDLSIFKGAPEVIIAASSRYLDENGEERNLTPSKIKELYLKQAELSKKGERVISVAYKSGADLALYGLTFLCFVSLRDKIRKEARAAIGEVSEAGVGVIMVTGDSRDTAEKIAKESGII